MSDGASAPADGSVPLVTVNEGDYVFCTGDTAGTLFVIQHGSVELLKPGAGRERLALLGPGDLLGEDSAFEDATRSCDARAVSATTLLPVAADTFTALVSAHPEVGQRIIASLGRRLFEARLAGVAEPRGEAPGLGARPPAVPPDASAPATAARVVSPRLVHPESGAEFAVPAQAEVVVGRADPRTRFQPDVELSSVDTQRSLSRRHARILRQDDRFHVIEEARVAKGTFVNGQRLTSGVPIPIAHGDEVCFGLIRTLFRTE